MITSPRNSQIREALKLRRKRNRDSTGLILVEGLRLIEDALGSGYRPQVLFYVPEWLGDNSSANSLIERLNSQGVDCLACSPAAFAPLAETISPQGMIALFPRPLFRLAEHAMLILVLDQVREPGNAGTLLRSAEAAGASQVLIAPNTVDPYNDKALRAGMGVHFRIPIQRCATWADVEQSCTIICDSAPTFYVADAHATTNYEAVDWSKPAVVIVGGEADGPSSEAKNLAAPIAIPMFGGTESLNAAIAGSVILFEAARQRRRAEPMDPM